MTALEEPGTLVTFDYEGTWGMPHDEPYDFHGTTRSILDVLRANKVSAMFFVVGRLLEEEHDLITMIANEGHAIGLHGYLHESRLDTFMPSNLSELQSHLKSVGALIEQLTGSPPIAFRAPYLLWPNYSDPAVTTMLRELGFVWMSNRKIRFAEELFKPGRRAEPTTAFAERLGLLSDKRLLGNLALALLNTQFLFHDEALSSLTRRLRWLLRDRNPFERSGIVEVAVSAPLDCELLGLPSPSELSSDAILAFASNRLIKGRMRQGNPYVLTFHDWVIGTGNRLPVLNDILEELARGGRILDARSWVPHIGGKFV